MVGERKQITVLFADLKGSMELLADRDPEEARRPLDAILERMHVLDALVRLIVRESQRQPLVLVPENLQWIDPETRTLLDTLLERVGSARLPLLVDYRPDYEHGWANRPGFTEIRIDALPTADADELLRTLLGDARPMRPLRELLTQRGSGNPFLLEEVVRALVETKVLVGERGAYRLAGERGALQVPPTIQAVLAARIDRLPLDEKLLLQSAYMGQSYHARGDYAQAERTLRENIEVSARDQATTSYVAPCGWLAFSLADLGAFDAATFYLAEAQRAAETTQHVYSRLIAWTLIGLVWIRRGRLARAVLPLERAMEACRRKHLTVWLPIPLSLLGLAFVRMGHTAEGLRLLEESVTLSRELGIRAYLSAWLVNLAEGLFGAGHVARARETAGQALEVARECGECGERGHEAQALQVPGDLAAHGPWPDVAEARERYTTAMQLAEELGLQPLVASCQSSLGSLDALAGDEPTASRRREMAQQIFDELDMRSWQEQAEQEVTELGHLFIVARSQPDLNDFLSQELVGAEKIRVLLDRRRGEQRQRLDELTEERRRAERRREQLDQDLRDWGFAVAPRRHG
jgi:tetratricopeptide (TPR) repeat protein